MRLSEAILLGDSLRMRNSNYYYYPTGNCGCAIGGAVLAAGRLRTKEFLSWKAVDEVNVYWPWFQPEHDKVISNMFAELCGTRAPYPYMAYESVASLEALCDVVVGWERDLESRGINVEQVSLAAELNQPASPTQSVQESPESLEQDVAK